MSDGECVKVVVRCRPANTREKELKSQKVVKIDRRNLSCSLIRGSEEPKTFTYDNVYDDDSLQKDVYDETAFPLVNSVMEGYNGTIFAYGQTGCGKTFTMEGIRSDPVLRGIIPRTFDQIFESIATNGGDGKKFLVAISYVEIYNEEVRDLLSDNPKQRMEVKEDPEKGVFIKNLTQPEVTSVEQIEHLMNAGNKNRSTGATAMNATSSRSHSLFTVRIETSESVPGTDEARIKAGKLNLVDLAGSERQSKTEATGDRLKEAQKINLSLSALGNVISALVVASGKTGRQAAEVHIPYRDSKLTRLLQDSLGGNTKTIMIAAVSPANDNYDETLSTLRYANRAKNIKNKPKVNEDPKDAMLREFQDEIKRLKAMLEERGLGDGGGGGGEKKKKKKKKRRMNADGVMEGGTSSEEEESEEEEDEEDQPKRVKKAKKKKEKKPHVDGEVEDISDEDDEDDDDGEIVDETEEGGGRRSKKKRGGGGGLDEFASPAERQKFEEARADFEAELAKIQAEKEKHETFARMLEEQMRVESEQASKIKEQTEAEKQAALREIEERLTREKEEHELKARELEEEMKRNKEEEEKKLAAHNAEIQSLQSEALNEKLALKAKLKKLQQKLMDGGKKHKTAAQEAEEKARLALEEAMKLKQQEAKEREAKLALEEEKLLLEENYSSIKDEVIGKTKKLKKLKKKFLGVQQEFDDSRREWEGEKEGYLDEIRQLFQELKLYKQISAQFLTKSDLEKIVKGSQWLEQKEEWQLPRIDLPVFFPTVRLIPGVGQNGGPGGAAKSGTRGGARPSVSTAGGKFQEEKGPDGWKKSVTAGFDRDEYNPNSNGKAVSRMAQQQAARQPSPSTRITASPAAPPSIPVPRNLDSLAGGQRTPRQMSPATSDHDPLQTNIARRPAFEGGHVSASPPADVLAASSNVARRPAFEGGVVSSSADSDDHAHVLNVMNQAGTRGTFAPDKSMTRSLNGSPLAVDINDLDSKVIRKATFNPSPISTTPSTHDDPLLSNEPAKRPAFSPAGSPTATADDTLAHTLQNGPAKRAAFNPTPMSTTSNDDDPLAITNTVPKRSAFEPSFRGGEPASGGPQTSLPSDLPAARSFQPAVVTNASLAGSSTLDILAAHSNLPSRAAFNPTSKLGSSPLAYDDPLASAPPARPSFQPATNSTNSAGAAPLNFPTQTRPTFAPNMTALQTSQPEINFPATPARPTFQPAKIL